MFLKSMQTGPAFSLGRSPSTHSWTCLPPYGPT